MNYVPQISQVVSGENYKVYLYFTDGTVRLYDAKPLLERGGVFDKLKDSSFYNERMTVMNGTLAWDTSGTRDTTQCIDIDPVSLYEMCPVVKDPLVSIA